MMPSTFFAVSQTSVDGDDLLLNRSSPAGLRQLEDTVGH